YHGIVPPSWLILCASEPVDDGYQPLVSMERPGVRTRRKRLVPGTETPWMKLVSVLDTGFTGYETSSQGIAAMWRWFGSVHRLERSLQVAAIGRPTLAVGRWSSCR